ncbi:MAG: PLDc_N domain-containing protein [Deltaproteobacteria bacterium]|nr:PLDc_N domain-containing protein [Deltaproteobacteria bacterium]OQY12719.1 MAG: hypothetical protein B6I30_04260 [Desulfobacteraceae bacterium 4572_187]MBW1957738.1 PLDc_N domain-containing protein [Deltaproteobacteria bacterium]MBW2014222.1 PLDc_N domain-containing protein [Deltaproteobacteria bacterium]MBW2089474.1 PLDc_N domain-containing protein [Deltaproteobacteria bacterium]
MKRNAEIGLFTKPSKPERITLDIATVIVWIKISAFFYLLTVLAIIDIIRKDFGTIGKKALWGMIALVPFVGWLVYLIFGFGKGKKPGVGDTSTHRDL